MDIIATIMHEMTLGGLAV